MAASQSDTNVKHPVSGRNPGGGASKAVVIRARDIMAAPVSTVSLDMTVHDLAVFLDHNKIGVAPVLDDDQIVGIVSISDLLQREELGTSPSISGENRSGSNLNFDKFHGSHVADVMSPNVLTITANTGLDVICELMLDANVRHLPVVDEKDLLGIVSRSDIVHTLAGRPEGAGSPRSYDDDVIRYKIMDVLVGFSGANPWSTTVDVLDGIVILSGSVTDESVLELSIEAIKEVDHVKQVEDHRVVLQPY